MRIKCIENKVAKLPEEIVNNYSISNSTFPVLIGKEYVVYGMTVHLGYVWYYICDESYSYYPTCSPSPLFDVVDGQLSRFWIYSYKEGERTTLSLRWTFPEWADKPDFYDDLTDTARVHGIYERVILHINDLPGIGGGQGVGGHVFLEFLDRKLFFGSYPERYKYDEKANVNLRTTSIESYCDSGKVNKGLESMEKIEWTRAHNCVYTAVEGLKVMEFTHADKLKLSKLLPLPSELKSQMIKLHGLDPNIISYPRMGVKISSASPFAIESLDVTKDVDHPRVQEVTDS